MNEKKRIENERKFKDWAVDGKGGRIYKMKLSGKFDWFVIYEKNVDKDENTISFTQYIYDENGTLKESHQKYPIDTGHKKL